MKLDEFKETCHEACSEKFNNLCIDINQNKTDSIYPIFNESESTYIEGTPETELFKKHNMTPINTSTLISINMKKTFLDLVIEKYKSRLLSSSI